ncbi:BgTH12-02498 [Blumeria graminis f. sp. triticale]|uniref:BgTH12-02498 n=1 Tax=Blumeria graminis f. sp. triticale TaxID=1689686 RepID=A0A9W4DI98_BLUGR|nr:BgTH12-02498 [Blumeria graminis f. sp. triticale]
MRLRPSIPRTIGTFFYRPTSSCLFRRSLYLNTISQPSRPQLSFLPIFTRQPTTRLISTETKEWLKQEIKIGVRYSAIITATGFLLLVMATGIQEEYRAHKYPTPDEWNWNTRLETRAAKAREDSDDPWIKNWLMIGSSYKRVIGKLHDSSREGQRIVEQSESTSALPFDIEGKLGYDVSQNSEPWRRGYYEVLAGLVRVAEQLDDYVRDKALDKFIAWPASSVTGPSNPKPRPLPVNMPPPPAEDDCVKAFESPEVYYKLILTTKGFTEKQRVDSAIAYGSWLEYKGKPELAEKMFKWAVNIASSSQDTSSSIVDASTYVIKANHCLPSENILSSTTALAIHYATNSRVDLALPIFITILRSRKSLPKPSPTMLSTIDTNDKDTNPLWKEALVFIKKCFTPPKYPPPPSDGSQPPNQDSKGYCEMAGTMLNIGEILYSLNQSKSNLEDGLAWTREAVDIAEVELQKDSGEDTKETCKRCLEAGLENWMIMVKQLAEKERRSGESKPQGLFNFGNFPQPGSGRWEREEEVVKDRIIRTSSLLSPSN